MTAEMLAKLPPWCRALLQRHADDRALPVEDLLDAVLDVPDSTPEAKAAAEHLPDGARVVTRRILLPEVAPAQVAPDLPMPDMIEAPVPPDVVITVDGVHLTTPCRSSVERLLADIARQIPHMVAPGAPAIELHFVDEGKGGRWWRLEPDLELALQDGDELRTHAPPKVPIRMVATDTASDALTNAAAALGEIDAAPPVAGEGAATNTP